MAVTSNDIANQAIQMIGDNQPAVTGFAPNFDSSPAGVALSKIYYPTVFTVARQFSCDFARFASALTLSGNAAPFPWSYEYLYPSSAVQIWQIMPPSLVDTNNPLPVNWTVANTLVSGTQTKVIRTNQASAVAVGNNAPAESTWDPLFREAVVRLLASNLALAVAGKPDMSKDMLESGGAFESLGQERDS